MLKNPLFGSKFGKKWATSKTTKRVNRWKLQEIINWSSLLLSRSIHPSCWFKNIPSSRLRCPSLYSHPCQAGFDPPSSPYRSPSGIITLSACQWTCLWTWVSSPGWIASLNLSRRCIIIFWKHHAGWEIIIITMQAVPLQGYDFFKGGRSLKWSRCPGIVSTALPVITVINKPYAKEHLIRPFCPH